MSIPRDVVDFLEGYPDVQDSPDSHANLQFYTNQRTCSPDNRTIDQIHAGCVLCRPNHGYSAPSPLMIDALIAGLGNTKHWKGAMVSFNGCEGRDWVPKRFADVGR